jgi:hypothetical protein
LLHGGQMRHHAPSASLCAWSLDWAQPGQGGQQVLLIFRAINTSACWFFVSVGCHHARRCYGRIESQQRRVEEVLLATVPSASCWTCEQTPSSFSSSPPCLSFSVTFRLTTFLLPTILLTYFCKAWCFQWRLAHFIFLLTSYELSLYFISYRIPPLSLPCVLVISLTGFGWIYYPFCVLVDSIC